MVHLPDQCGMAERFIRGKEKSLQNNMCSSLAESHQGYLKWVKKCIYFLLWKITPLYVGGVFFGKSIAIKYAKVCIYAYFFPLVMAVIYIGTAIL